MHPENGACPARDGPPQDGRGRLCRRTVLLAGSGAALLAAAGCAGSANPGGAVSTAPAGPRIVLGPAADVPVGSARIYPERALVVTQPSPGTFRGFSNVCTHDGCAINRVEGAALICPCHGSRFALDGSVLRGPALSALSPARVSVSDGQLVLG